MSVPEDWDEFDLIERLFRPLTQGAPEALNLRDDAAVIPSRPGYDLVITTDTLIEGVHFLADDPPDLVARKLLRVNLSDLAAKAAVPYGYFLNVSWPHECPAETPRQFAAGLARDQRTFDLKLFGGDTTATPGPLTVGATLLGWVATGAMVRRAGARAGDLLLVSGVIGDAHLGLTAAQVGLDGFAAWENEVLAQRYRLPLPRLDLRGALAQAHACADVSDGLIADAGHLARASGLALEIDLERLPMSPLVARWVDGQANRVDALARLAAGGDDYELVCAAAVAIDGFTVVGRFVDGEGTQVRHQGRPVRVNRAGFRHGKDG